MAETGGADAGVWAVAIEAASGVMAIDRAAVRGRNTELLVMLTSIDFR